MELLMTIRALQAAVMVLGLAGAALAQAPAAGSFAAVAPIFNKHCLMCHSPQGKASGLVVATAADILRGGKNAPDVVPGNSAGSRLVQMLDGTIKPRMPLGGELAPGEIAAIRAWIDSGADAGAAAGADAKDVSAPPAVAGAAPAPATAAPSGSYESVAPIFQKNCVLCHNSDRKTSGLVVETYAGLMQGGKHGLAIVAGQSAMSRMVQMLEGTIKPRMPLGGELAAANIAVIKAWIDAGAKGPNPGAAALPTGIPELAVPDIKASSAVVSPVYALAYSPDGKYIALGGYRQVRVLDARDGRLLWTLNGHADAVRALVFSSDGSWLAAAGGPPQRGGEIKIWNLPSGTLRASLYGHRDGFYALAVSPDNTLLASGSYDKRILLWQVPATQADLKPPKLLKDHNDAVFAVAFSPDGTRLASGSADRTVKVWDVATGRRLYTLGDALDVVNTVAFDPSGKHLAAAGMDKTIRTYLLGDKQATLDQTMIAHEDSVLHLVYTPDGKQILSTASDHTLKVFDAATLNPIRDLASEPDWVQAMALSPDGKELALGQYNGQFTVLNLATDKPVLGPLTGFAAPMVATARR